jgi:hypothetical protein
LTDGCSTQLNGQKAFMTGKLKTKGNMMLATKLDGVLKVCSVVLMSPFTSHPSQVAKPKAKL